MLFSSCTVLIQANAGDSRTVLGRKGHAIPLSKDHKPYEESTFSSLFKVLTVQTKKQGLPPPVDL
jgi:serine/threonine protein phosphatase PrpC